MSPGVVQCTIYDWTTGSNYYPSSSPKKLDHGVQSAKSVFSVTCFVTQAPIVNWVLVRISGVNFQKDLFKNTQKNVSEPVFTQSSFSIKWF